MSNNHHAPLNLRKSRSSWDEFDRLPRDVRDALNYAAFRYSTKGLNKMRDAASQIKLIDSRAVAVAYEQREAIDELREIGL